LDFFLKQTSNIPPENLILIWTRIGRKERQEAFLNGLETKCELKSCRATLDRFLFNKSRAVLFHLRDIDVNDLPTEHIPGQYWVLYYKEAPYNQNVGERFIRIEKHINITICHRQDADISELYYDHIHTPDDQELERERNISEKIDFEKKTKQIAWFVSHCHTNSRREDYVSQLQKYMNVDIYGACGPLKCNRSESKACYEMAQEKYKFYLSFENSVNNGNKKFLHFLNFLIINFSLFCIF